MARINLKDDIHSMSDFRSNMSKLLDQARSTQRPIVLTQHGASCAVLLGVEAYERLLDRIEVLEDIHAAEREHADGKSMTSDDAMTEVLAEIQM